MAGNQALAAVGRSIVDLLNRRIVEAIPVAPRPTAVMAGTTDFDQVNASPVAVIRYPSISLYCYRISVDRETRPGWSAVSHRDGIARLPLRMHFMVSAWDSVVESELQWLGLAAQILESESVLTGPLLHPSGLWRPGDSVQVVTDDVALESMSEAFQALTTDYRLSLLYLARVVCIEGRQVETVEPVTTVAARAEQGTLVPGRPCGAFREHLETAVGTATVLHRMALAVEVLDAVTGGRVRARVRIDREVDPLVLPPGHRAPPLLPLTPRDSGRALILFDRTVPTAPVRLRVWDPERRHAPRRFDLPLWALADLEAAESGPPEIGAASRVLRPHLHPGAAWPSPRGTTVIRGRVESGGVPVRWARVSAVRTGDIPIGHGHADDRGEFVVVLVDTGTLPPPTPTTVSVDLVVTAPDPTTAPDVDDRDPLADLVVEPVARTSSPPLPAEVDNDVLRGLATPAGHVPNSAAVPTLVVPTGAELVLTQPIPFAA